MNVDYQRWLDLANPEGLRPQEAKEASPLVLLIGSCPDLLLRDNIYYLLC